MPQYVSFILIIILNKFNSACAEQATKGKKVTSCEHNDEERSLFGTWTTFELQLALENGYVITQVTGVCF